MKKSRIIALTLALAMIMMGTAYAAWTQTVNVAATVETGSLEVKVLDAVGASEVIPAKWAEYKAQGIDLTKLSSMEGEVVADGVVDVDAVEGTLKEDGSVVYEGLNFFPGNKFHTTTKYENTGSIPVDVAIATVAAFDMPYNPGPGKIAYVVKVIVDGEVVYSANPQDLKLGLNEVPEFTVEPTEKFDIVVSAYFWGGSDEKKLSEEAIYNFGYSLNVTQFNID